MTSLHSRGLIWFPGGLVLLGAFLLAFAATHLLLGGSEATNAGLTYARQKMVWLQGPTVRSSHTVPLHELDALLNRTVGSSLRRHVNVPDLIRRYGAGRQVTLVVLDGTYNSLPPDEGVNVRGEVVSLVDTRTDRVLLLTD